MGGEWMGGDAAGGCQAQLRGHIACVGTHCLRFKPRATPTHCTANLTTMHCVKVKETAASLNSVAAAWLGSRPLAAGLRNAHPGTVQRCGCGQPGRYLSEDLAYCSKACAAEAGEELRELQRWWNSPRMGEHVGRIVQVSF